MKKYILIILLISALFTSCHNGDWEFSDYDYTAVYFAYQTPVRTIVLGEDVFDTSLDNEHKCQIMATMGGVYANNVDRIINFQVDNSLCNSLVFEDGSDVAAMPANYYSLSSDKITIPKGSVLGGVTVSLTDAFFADPLALKNTYVIPVVMTGVQNADSILRGAPLTANPNRAIADNWDIAPKDYILYAVKYINPWDAYYLRRGKDVIVKDGVTETKVRQADYVEKDEVFKLTTLSMSELDLPTDFQNQLGNNLNLKIKLNFSADQKCTVTPVTTAYQLNDTVSVYNITAKGNGQFVKKGEKNSWGNKDRDALYLDYEVGYEVEIRYPKAGLPTNNQVVKYNTTDTLVVRDRGVKPETFTPKLK
ncbi:hypothetical protein FACS189426_18650 [Bacteroidia bacterium]|nr:hypothetical protein FACS189426_18650 [Bacteroidia bacterium]